MGMKALPDTTVRRTLSTCGVVCRLSVLYRRFALLKTQTPRGAFRTTVNQYGSSVSVGSHECAVAARLCAAIAITPVCRLRVRHWREEKMAHCGGWITNAASAAVVSGRVLTTPDLSIMKHRLPINARFASIVWKPGCYACVESCVGGARIIGDIKDPHSRISMLHQHRDAIKVLKPERNGTSPRCFSRSGRRLCHPINGPRAARALAGGLNDASSSLKKCCHPRDISWLPCG